jgi:hypothetical protein
MNTKTPICTVLNLLKQAAASIQSSSPVIWRPASLNNDDGGMEVSKMLHVCSKLTQLFTQA